MLPGKPVFRRSEVVKLVKLEGRVLDFWEKEFGGFKASVNEQGETVYQKRDVEIIMEIKHLLTVERKDKQAIKKIVGEKAKLPVDSTRETGQVESQTTPSFPRRESRDGKQTSQATHTQAKKKEKEKKVKIAGTLSNQAEAGKKGKKEKEILKIIRTNLQEILTILDKNGKKYT